MQQQKRNDKQQYLFNNQYQQYNAAKKNIDMGVNNYQMFSNRSHQRNFTPIIGINTSLLDNSNRNISSVNNHNNNHQTSTNKYHNNNQQNLPNNYQNDNIHNKFSQSNNELTLEKCDPFQILKKNLMIK